MIYHLSVTENCLFGLLRALISFTILWDPNDPLNPDLTCNKRLNLQNWYIGSQKGKSALHVITQGGELLDFYIFGLAKTLSVCVAFFGLTCITLTLFYRTVNVRQLKFALFILKMIWRYNNSPFVHGCQNGSCSHSITYTAKLLFHQSPTRDSDYHCDDVVTIL